LKFLQQGGVVLMGPDGMQGRRSVPLKVLGATAYIGAGAAFLAHASGSNTAWYTVVRKGECFAPTIEIGPTPRSGERSEEFSERLHVFYSRKIEEFFSGDPLNISLLRHWTKPFAEAAQA
jgi:hypothetical protein